MQITPSTLDAAFVAFDTLFQQAYKDTPTYWQEFATRVPSNTREQRHAWIKMIPELREWLGERQIENLSVSLQALVNKKYEKTFGIDRVDFEDDVIGVYGSSVQELATQAKRWPDKILVTALQAGSSTGLYGPDGLAFFHASHPINPDDTVNYSTQQNYWSSGKALTAANYNIVRSAMRAYKDESGVPLEINPNMLIVPPSLESAARQIVESEYFTAVGAFGAIGTSGTSQNVLKGTAKVLVVPRLENEATAWYLADTTRAVKPMIFQDRMAPEFAYLNKTDDANVFLQDKFVFGVRARGAAGYGPYWLIAKAIA